jgi:hypothetical protein
MSLINLGLIFVAGLDLGLAILIYLLNPKNKININLALSIFFLATWTLGVAMFREAKTESAAFIWTWVQNGSGSFVVVPFFLFSLYFPYQNRILEKWHKVLIVLSILIISIVVVVPGIWTKEIYLSPSKNDYSLNFLGVFYFNLHFFGYLILAFYNLVTKYIQNEGFIKKQLFHMIIAAGIISLFGGMLAAIIPLILLRSIGPYWIGPYFAVPTVIILLRFIYKKD